MPVCCRAFRCIVSSLKIQSGGMGMDLVLADVLRQIKKEDPAIEALLPTAVAVDDAVRRSCPACEWDLRSQRFVLCCAAEPPHHDFILPSSHSSACLSHWQGWYKCLHALFGWPYPLTLALPPQLICCDPSSSSIDNSVIAMEAIAGYIKVRACRSR